MRSTEWAAGLFEGEGCIYIEKPSPSGRRGVRLVVSSTDLDVLECFQSIVGCGGIYSHTGKTYLAREHKPLWQWRAGAAEDVFPLLRKLEPYLGVRRKKKIKEALACEF